MRVTNRSWRATKSVTAKYEGGAFEAYATTVVPDTFALERFVNTATGLHYYATSKRRRAC